MYKIILVDSGKHAGLQSAKPKQATDANLWGHNFQSSSKADPFEKSRGNKNQKDAKTDNVFDVIKNNKGDYITYINYQHL